MNNKVWLKVPSPATGNKAWLNFPPPAGRATAAGPVRPPVADPAPPASHSHSPPQHAPLPPTLLTACPPSGQSHTPRGSPASRVHRCGTRPPPFHSLPPFWTKPYAKWKSCQLGPPLRYPPPPPCTACPLSGPSHTPSGSPASRAPPCGTPPRSRSGEQWSSQMCEWQ